MTLKMDRAAARLRELALAAGPNGIRRDKAWSTLDEEGLLPPADKPRQRGALAVKAGVRRFGADDCAVYVHDSFVDEKKQKRAAIQKPSSEEETLTYGQLADATVTIVAPGLEIVVRGVNAVTVTRRKP